MAGNPSWLRRSSPLLSNFLDLANRITTTFTPNPDFKITTLEPDYLNLSTMQGDKNSRTSTSLCPIWVRSTPRKESASVRCLYGFKPMFHIFFDRHVTGLSRPNSPDKVTRAQAQIVIENCRIEYKTLRPHCALRCLPPASVAIEPGGSPNLVGANAI